MADVGETELALAPRDDIRTAAPSAAVPLAEEPAPNPVEMVFDRLHGRWPWIAIASAILAPALAVAGYLLTPVLYASSGTIAVVSEAMVITEKVEETASPSSASALVEELASNIRSDRVIQEAMMDARMKPFSEYLTRKGMGAFSKGLSVFQHKLGGLVIVQMESEDPRFSAAAVNSLIDAIRNLSPNREKEVSDKIEANRRLLSETRVEIDLENQRLLELITSSQWRTASLQPLVEARVADLERVQAEIAAVEAAMNRIRTSVAADGGDPSDDARLEPTQLELDHMNPALPDLRREVDSARMQLHVTKDSYSESHPIHKNVKKRLTMLESQLEREQALAVSSWMAGPGQAQSFGELTRTRARLDESLMAIRGEIDQMNQTMAGAEMLRRKLARLADEERMYDDRIKELNRERDAITESRIAKRWDAVANLTPSKDRRAAMAVAGAVGGIGVVLGAFFLWGTLDRRAFGTRQLSGTGSGKLLCAGAIPDMDALSGDPSEKDLATSCIHRIRTRIESRRTPGDGYALMVSSPFQGDGKTTLAVALAWSYAESGTRTLLVDNDFVGQALSFQFGQLAAPGVREALQGADLSGLIVPSGGENLWILPVGRDRAFGASRVHPTGLRRLFRELRNRFDMIIIDTGPMTASIEPLPVAAASDGVVLSLRRGRSRSRLDECIADIGSVGAEYLGVVLNCADRKDCMRYGSVSRMSQDVTRALQGERVPAPSHPLLSAVAPSLGGAEQRREGDAA